MTLRAPPAQQTAPLDPRDAFLARTVPGRSFADVGGLWGVVNEKVSVAARLGAAEVTMIDISSDGPGSMWEMFDQRMNELGVTGYGKVRQDVCLVEDLCFDVVHCSGVLYHHPHPLELLSALARLSRRWVILTTAVLPPRIENTAGTFDTSTAAAVFLPALSSREREVLRQHWLEVGASALGLDRGAHSLGDFGPWWWLPTAETLRAMCEVCDLTVVESEPSWNGHARTLLLEKRGAAAMPTAIGSTSTGRSLAARVRSGIGTAAMRIGEALRAPNRDPDGDRRVERAASSRAPTLEAAIERLRRSNFREIQRRGFHFQPNDFYSPLIDCDFLERNGDLWWERPTPAAIEWRDQTQLELVAALAPFLRELRDVPQDPSPVDRTRYAWNNGFWNNADALVQYGLYRLLRPRRIVEIGCGWSTLLMRRALEANGESCSVDLVEPYPDAGLLSDLPDGWRLHQTILQRAPLELFTALRAGDVCFYDGSHCAKTASDVNWFFFEVLPRLEPGVLVHLHDIFLPDDYPHAWIFEQGRSWNEQYVLQAFLMYNPAFEILVACRYLWKRHGEVLETHFQSIQPPYGCSFWMRRRPASPDDSA